MFNSHTTTARQMKSEAHDGQEHTRDSGTRYVYAWKVVTHKLGENNFGILLSFVFWKANSAAHSEDLIGKKVLMRIFRENNKTEEKSRK